MKIVIQKVSRASVTVEEKEISCIGKGILILVGIEKEDSTRQLQKASEKILNLRIFEDENGKSNLSVKDISGEILVVSQFTLASDTRKGNRPSFTTAEDPEKANNMISEFVSFLKGSGLKVLQGEFGSHMKVDLVNDGPVTYILNY